MQEIIDIDDPSIAIYRSLKKNVKNAGTKSFIADGSKVVQRALDGQLKVHSLFALPTFYKKMDHISDSIIQYVASKKIMEEIVGHNLHQGIMAHVATPPETKLKVLKPPYVIIENSTNADNIGSIIRNAVALGINSVILGPLSGSLYLRRSVRVSMGSCFHCDYYQSPNLLETIKTLQAQGTKIIGTTPNSPAKNLSSYSFSKNSACMIGNEGYGIAPKIQAACDEMLKIPMKNNFDSINAGNASAIFLYHMTKDF